MKQRQGFLATIMANPKIIILIVGLLVVFGIYGLDKMNKQEFLLTSLGTTRLRHELGWRR